MKRLSLSFILLLSACSTKSTSSFSEDAPKTFIRSEMAPLPLLVHTEQYLEWTKGYNFRIRDRGRGILVTDWVFDSPNEKHQVTIRVNSDVESSSMLSAHTSFQHYENGLWNELPSNNTFDAALVEEIATHIQNLEDTP